jgi:hypothetical protein
MIDLDTSTGDCSRSDHRQYIATRDKPVCDRNNNRRGSLD